MLREGDSTFWDQGQMLSRDLLLQPINIEKLHGHMVKHLIQDLVVELQSPGSGMVRVPAFNLLLPIFGGFFQGLGLELRDGELQPRQLLAKSAPYDGQVVPSLCKALDRHDS